MNRRVLWAASFALFGLTALQGCQHQRPRPCPPGPCGAPAAGAILSAPPPGALTAPPAGAITTPPAGAYTTPPPGNTFVPPTVGAPGVPPVDVRRYEPNNVATAEPPLWKPPANPGVRLAVPEAFVPPPQDSARLLAPETPPERMPKILPSRPEVAEERSTVTPALPVDIPQFNSVKRSVASGLTPYADGLTWLRDKGYHTVFNIRVPGQDDSAARELTEKRGLRYLSLELSPETLTEEKIKEFNRIVNDEGNLPLFVYDKGGSLAGGLWYLYLRTSEMLPEDEARTKAATFGLKPDEHKAMWQAIQKYFTGAAR